jgi:glucose/arabinose dehydrogenase
VRTTFASGLSGPEGLAFDSTGDLFEADSGSGNIFEFTPSGVKSTFASGLDNPNGLAFQPEPTPEPSALGLLAVGAAALLVRRRRNLVG